MTNPVDDQEALVSLLSAEDEPSLLDDLDILLADIGPEVSFDDDLSDMDCDSLEAGRDEPYAIYSFEDLEKIVWGERPFASKRYVFKATDVGSDLIISAKSPRLILDYLPAYIGISGAKHSMPPESIKAFKHTVSRMNFSKNDINAAIRCFDEVDVLNSSIVIGIEKEFIKLPYGQFDAFVYQGYGSFNPLILDRIVDIYCKESVFNRHDLIDVIEKNLYENIYTSSSPSAQLNPVLEKMHLEVAIISPEFIVGDYVELGQRSSKLWTAVDEFFFKTILPLAFMNDHFKSYVGKSLLSHEDFTEANYKRIIEAYIYYVCGISEIARLINTKSKDIASFDAKSIFGGKYSPARRALEASEQHAAVTKAKAVREIFAEGEKRVTIDLTGLSVPASAMAAFMALGKKHPHFSSVFDYLLPFVESSFFNGTPLCFPPMLIAGPPGIGKTKFISELFGVFGYPISHCHSSQYTCGSGLVGLQSTWSTAQPGYVTEALRKSKYFNPLIAFDELERIRMAHDGGNGISVEAAFMRLLEPLEASRFVDACGQLPHDVSKVNWVFTCNNPAMIPPALLTRLNKVCVYPPTDESVIDNIHRDIWLDLVNQYASGGLIKPWISADALENLREVYYEDLNFRSGIKVMKKGLNKLMSGMQASNYLTLDVISSKALKRASLN
jgi:hypothetical protein